jgi:hypothetical protein
MKTILAAFTGIPNVDNVSQENATVGEWNLLANDMGQTPTMMLTYLDGNHPLSQWVGDSQWDIASWKAGPWANTTVNLSMPMTFTGDNADTDFKAIASGQWDSTINAVLNTWSSAGYKDIYLRPGWEMNGNWMSWSVSPANAGDFVAAFQHISQVAHTNTSASVHMVWSPNEGNYNSTPIASYYPGNAAVDIIAIDTYGAPVDRDTTPSASAVGPSDFTLNTALQMAKANGKPLALGETGGTDAAFPANLASVINASGVSVVYAGLWDSNVSGQDLRWASNPPVGAAWKNAFNDIASATAAIGTTPTPSTISHLSLILSDDAFRGNATFIAKVDGKVIGGPTQVTASHGFGQTQKFDFTGQWPAGSHTLEIDFTNDLYRPGVGDRNLYVNQIFYNGSPHLNTTSAMFSNGALTIPLHG